MNYILYGIIILGGIFEFVLFCKGDKKQIFASMFFLVYGITSVINEITHNRNIMIAGAVVSLILGVVWVILSIKSKKKRHIEYNDAKADDIIKSEILVDTDDKVSSEKTDENKER